MRRYDDPVEVRRGWVTGPGHQGEGPEQFLWRGRLWLVRSVVARWVETGAWWTLAEATDSAETGETGEARDPLDEREVWRVEAGRGAPRRDPDGPEGSPEGPEGSESRGGVFDLAFDWADGRWQLVGCLD